MKKPVDRRKETARHALATKSVPTKAVRHETKTTPSADRYVPIDGLYQGGVDHGTLIGLRLKDEAGNIREYIGDRRMMLEALNHLKRDAPIRVHWHSDWDWHLQRFDEGSYDET